MKMLISSTMILQMGRYTFQRVMRGIKLIQLMKGKTQASQENLLQEPHIMLILE